MSDTIFDGVNKCERHKPPVYHKGICPACSEERIKMLEDTIDKVREILKGGRAGANVDHALNVIYELDQELKKKSE